MPRAPRIPRRIIHIFSAPAGRSPNLPLLYKAAKASATLLNPDFEHVLFDKEKIEGFLQDEPVEHRRAMDSFRFPIQRFDFFRYLAIYRFGGFYMDLDVILARDLSPLLNFSCVFPFEELTLSRFLRNQLNMDWEIGNYAFGAAPGHPMIKAVIDNCIRAQQDPEWADLMFEGIPKVFRKQFFVVNTTGPGIVSRTLAERKDLQKTVAILFPDDVCEEQTWHRFGDYGVHLMHASWRKPDNIIYRRLARFWENRSRRESLNHSRALGPLRPGTWTSSFPGHQQ